MTFAATTMTTALVAAGVSTTTSPAASIALREHADPACLSQLLATRGGGGVSDGDGSGRGYVHAFYQIPQPGRYFISGNLGNIIFYLTERVCSWLLLLSLVGASHDSPPPPSWADSFTFFAAYLLHVPAQHYLHALLVYGMHTINTTPKYWTTLTGTYSAFMVSAVGSTVLNTTLLKIGLSRPIAFMATIWIFSIVNYLVIGWVVRQSNKAEKKGVTRVPRSSPPPPSTPSHAKVHRGGGFDCWMRSKHEVVERKPLCVPRGTIGLLSSTTVE